MQASKPIEQHEMYRRFSREFESFIHIRHPELTNIVLRIDDLLKLDIQMHDETVIALLERRASLFSIFKPHSGKLYKLSASGRLLPRVDVRPDFAEAHKDRGFLMAVGYFLRVAGWVEGLEARFMPQSDDI